MVGDVMNWLPAIGSLVGSIGQGIFSAHSASKAFERQKELWTYMQSNAHQLEVQDLKAAGLNPILSAMNGQLASMPSVGQERTPDNDLGAALNSAMSAAVADKSANITYDLGLKKLALEDKALKIQSEQSAAQIAKLEEDKNLVLEQIKGVIIDNSWKNEFNNASLREKNEMINALVAQVGKYGSETDLLNTQIRKLELEMKYGGAILSVLPPKLVDQVANKLPTLVGSPEFPGFIDEYSNAGSRFQQKKVIEKYLEKILNISLPGVFWKETE